MVARLMNYPAFIVHTAPPKYPHANDKATNGMTVLLGIYEPLPLLSHLRVCIQMPVLPPANIAHRLGRQDHSSLFPAHGPDCNEALHMCGDIEPILGRGHHFLSPSAGMNAMPSALSLSLFPSTPAALLSLTWRLSRPRISLPFHR